MAKRTSASNDDTINDVDMAIENSNVDQATAKKIKVDDQLDNKMTFAYPNDAYIITSEHLKNSTFEILYMATRARAETPRMLLEYVGASYVSLAPINWPAGKKDTPFGVLPVLTHIKANGKRLVVPEVPTITRYLARLFGLTGSTLEDEVIVDACFQSAVDNILSTMMSEIFMKPDPKAKETVDTALEKLAPFFDGFEGYLVQNGSNGYLLGEKTTYAEFPWYDWIQYLMTEYSEQMKDFISETVRPATYKLYQRFQSNPRIQAYIEGGRWNYRPAKPITGIATTGVIVADAERSLDFYQNKLELKVVVNKSPQPEVEGNKWIEFSVDDSQKVKFSVYSHGKNNPYSSPSNDSSKHTGIIFSVRNVRETYDKLVKKGVKFNMQPMQMPWGVIAQFEDPDGNLFSISGPADEKLEE